MKWMQDSVLEGVEMIQHTGLIARIISITALIMMMCTFSWGAGVRVVPSSSVVKPGEDFYFDVVAEGIPASGLGGVQFRLSATPSAGTVSSFSDLSQSGTNDIAVVSPLLVSPAVSGHSGMGDFFWNGKGPNGILMMDNESLVNGTGLYTFAHTSGSQPQSGSGVVARFAARIGSNVKAERLDIALSDAMLMDGGPAYTLDYVTGTSVQLRCISNVPSVSGLTLTGAQAALTAANLTLGNICEIDNPNGLNLLNVVLQQSSPTGSELDCKSPVNLAINTPPANPTNLAVSDKPNDESGAVVLAWTPPLASDTAGYRVYSGNALIKQVAVATANAVEIGGLANVIVTRLRVTAYDTFGNESGGALIDAIPIDDVKPVIALNGVIDGSFYRNDVAPLVTVTDASPVIWSAILNSAPFSLAPIDNDGNYTLTISAVDQAGNSSSTTVSFVVDKTMPAIVVSNVLDNTFYKAAVSPVVTISDTNLKTGSISMDCQPFVSGATVSAAGNHVLQIIADDYAGNSATQTIHFTIDTTPPVLSVSTLSDGSYTNNEVLNIAGTVADDIGIKELRVNGTIVLVQPDGSFSHAMLMVAGANRIEIVATDLADNTASDVRTVTMDQAAPILVVTVPADNSKTGAALIDVTGSVDETSTVTVTLGSSTHTAAMTGSVFTAPLVLTPGYNTIEVTATDLANNRNTLKRTVVYDDQNPSLAVTIPALDIRTNLGGLTIRGTVSDPYTAVSVTITMDGQTFYPPVVNGQFEQAVTFVTEKSYSIQVTAVNEVGSSTTAQRNVIYDITPPSLAIGAVTSPTVLPSQVIGGTREAGVAVTVTCPTATVGSVEYPTETTWQASLAGMRAGDNVITAQAYDAGGNQTVVYAHVAVLMFDSDVSFSVSPNVIWPLSHKMVAVTINGKVNIPDADLHSLEILLTDEYGAYSYRNLKFGSTVLIEAWRYGTDPDGRKYTITAVVTRRDGSKTTTITSVLVPHDMK